MVTFINGLPAQRWLRLTAKRNGYAQEGSANSKVRTQDTLSVSLLLESSKTDTIVTKTSSAEIRLTAARAALYSVKELLNQAREVADSANQVGADRSALTDEANQLISQANETISAASVDGIKVFDPVTPSETIPTNPWGQSSFTVNFTNTTGTPSEPTKMSTTLRGSTKTTVSNEITTGADGSIYQAGMTYNGSTGVDADAFLTKYDSRGQLVWTRTLNSSTNAAESANAVTTGTDGSIYLGGVAYGSVDGQVYSGQDDGLLSKYNSDGTKVWTRMLGTAGEERIEALTSASDGAIYAVGNTTGNLDGQVSKGGTVLSRGTTRMAPKRGRVYGELVEMIRSVMLSPLKMGRCT